MAISRMKDFYDIWALAQQFSFEQASLAAAIAATFARRGTAMPEEVPTALTDEFAADRGTFWSGLIDEVQIYNRVVKP